VAGALLAEVRQARGGVSFTAQHKIQAERPARRGVRRDRLAPLLLVAERWGNQAGATPGAQVKAAQRSSLTLPRRIHILSKRPPDRAFTGSR
jgi:hypothetical protein